MHMGVAARLAVDFISNTKVLNLWMNQKKEFHMKRELFLKTFSFWSFLEEKLQGRRNSRGRGTFWPISIFIYRKSIEVFYSLMSILI